MMIYNLCSRQENLNNTDHHGPLAASCDQYVGARVDSRSPFVYIRFLSFTGQRRIIHARRSELWHRSKAKSSIKSCFGQNYECVYKVWCQTVALKSWYLYFLPDTPETTFDWDRLRNLETRFTDHTRRIHDPRHGLLAIITLQSSIKSFIYVL